MGLKNKIFQVVLRVICAIFLILAIFMGVIAVICSFGGGIPNIFGSNVYIVETDAFGFLNKGTALFAQQVHYSEIQPKNVVIFRLENNKPAIGQVLKSDLYDGVYSFEIITDNNIELTLTQSQVVAKGMSFSDFWGGVIRFASSPLGMLLVAVVPCVVIIIVELTKFITKVIPQPEIETVKKQYEVPTYIPDSGKQSAAGRGKAVSAYKRTAALDDSIGLYDANVRRSTSVERTDVLGTSRSAADPLYSRKKPQTPPPRRNNSMPLSQKKLNEAIAASKAQREQAEMQRQREEAVNEIKKNRSAAIAAEKELEEKGKTGGLTSTAAIRNRLSGTKEIIDQNAIAKAAKTANLPKPAPDFKPEFTPPQRPLAQRPSTQGAAAPKPETPVPEGPAPARTTSSTGLLRRSPRTQAPQEEPVRQYSPRENQPTHTTTSIPRLDSLLNDDADTGRGYSIDEILAGIDRKKQE